MQCPVCHERNCCHTRPRMLFVEKQSQWRRDREREPRKREVDVQALKEAGK
jgi:hypothetical protein